MLAGLNGVMLKRSVRGSMEAYGYGGTCKMAVRIDDILDPGMVAAIEVYARGGNLPVRLPANDTRCGVIAIWTGARQP